MLKLIIQIWTLHPCFSAAIIRYITRRTSRLVGWATLRITRDLQRRALKTQLMAAWARKGQSTLLRVILEWQQTIASNRNYPNSKSIMPVGAQARMAWVEPLRLQTCNVYLCRLTQITWRIRVYLHKKPKFNKVRFSMLPIRTQERRQLLQSST